MATTSRRKRTGDVQRKPPADARPIELIVRRGALWRYNILKKKTAELPVTVLWDRRLGERRSGEEGEGVTRRGPERRQKPPYTWEVADFLVVGQTSSPEPDEAPKVQRKKRRQLPSSPAPQE